METNQALANFFLAVLAIIATILYGTHDAYDLDDKRARKRWLIIAIVLWIIPLFNLFMVAILG